MEKQTFKIKFSVVIILLCVAILLLCALGIALSVLRILQEGIHGVTDALKSPFLIAVCLLCIVIVVSLLIRSQYVVTDEHFITQFGLIKSKFVIKNITSLLLDRQTNKLSVYFGEEFTVVSTSPAWQEQFVRALLAVNPDIRYGFTLTEPTKEEKQDKDEK